MLGLEVLIYGMRGLCLLPTSYSHMMLLKRPGLAKITRFCKVCPVLETVCEKR